MLVNLSVFVSLHSNKFEAIVRELLVGNLPVLWNVLNLVQMSKRQCVNLDM